MLNQIRIAVFDTNTAYADRFCKYMGERYGDIYSFFRASQKSDLDNIIKNREAEVLLVPAQLKEEYPVFIYDIRVGYLTDIRTGQKAEILRYQSLRGLENDIQNLLRLEDTTVHLVAFAGAGNFVGTSTLAAAYAKRQAAKERSVLYLNVDNEGDPHTVYHIENVKDLNTIYSTVSTNGDGEKELAGALNRDLDGVYYVNNTRAPFLSLNLSEKQMYSFLQRLIAGGKYRTIIVESRMEMNPALFAAMDIADRVILVCDGTNASINCMDRAWNLIESLEEKGKAGLTDKTAIMYNRFQKQFGRRYQNEDIPVKGILTMLPPKRPAELAEQLSKDPVLDDILR